MARDGRFDLTVFLVVLAGIGTGAVVAVTLYLVMDPSRAVQVVSRPAVLSTLVIPLGCLVGWLLSRSRERAPTAAMACFGLYFLSAFLAARLGTFFPRWNYFATILIVQSVAGLGLAVVLGFVGREERPRPAGEPAGPDLSDDGGGTRSEVR